LSNFHFPGSSSFFSFFGVWCDDAKVRKLIFCFLILCSFSPILGMESMVMNTPPNSATTNTTVGANGEDLATLEAEITELQRENARVEGQMLRLKSDINAIETHLTHGERVRFPQSSSSTHSTHSTSSAAKQL
jgi:septal ring factor EnvC (AmiA/AmiB activator)